MSQENEWLSLGEAAEILGVHPSTLRHWADSGELPSQRTPGGHRRFRRGDLRQWALRKERDMAPAEARLMLQSALGRARLEISEGQLHGQTWYESMDEEARQIHRRLGRRLLELLSSYLTEPEDYDRLRNEVRSIGEEYAQLSLSEDLSLADSVRAFLFFRDLLLDSVTQLAEMLNLHTPQDWSGRFRQVYTVTDDLLLALIEEYE